MRNHGRRKKKLTVAFHFGPHAAAWRCDECRRQRLEARRRCGFLGEAERAARKIVWAKGRVGIEECPTSYVTAQSLEWIEKFFTWKFAGGSALNELAARDADAFLILEREWRDGQQSGG